MANYKTDLASFINNLEVLNNNPIKVTKDFIVEFTYSVLHAMASLTIQDTNQARYLLIHKFAEKYGYSYDDLNTHYYNFWLNSERENRGWGRNSGNSKMSEKISKKSYEMNLKIQDDGLYAQEYAEGAVGGSSGTFGGALYPSETHANATGRNNYKYKIRHLTYISDLINNGKYGSIDNLNFDKLIEKLVTDIEIFLFTGKT